MITTYIISDCCAIQVVLDNMNYRYYFIWDLQLKHAVYVVLVHNHFIGVDEATQINLPWEQCYQ